MKKTFWIGFVLSILLLFCSFPQLWLDRWYRIPKYMMHLNFVHDVVESYRPGGQNQSLQFREPGWQAFCMFSLLNLPVWALLDTEYRHEWVKVGTTRDNWIEHEKDAEQNNFRHLFRVTWESDGRFITTAAILTALWWYSIAEGLRVLDKKRQKGALLGSAG